MLLTLALFAGGAASAANAADVQNDYIDPIQATCDNTEGVCDDIERLRNSQAAGAVSISLCCKTSAS